MRKLLDYESAVILSQCIGIAVMVLVGYGVYIVSKVAS